MTKPVLVQKSILFLSMVLVFACAVPVFAGLPTTYNQNFRTSPNPVRALIAWSTNAYYLAFTDFNNYSNPTFTLVGAPTNGILEYRSDYCNGRWLPVPINVAISNNTVNFSICNNAATFNNCKWSYTCTNGAMSAIGSMDSFTWKMANNEGSSTNYYFGGSLATCIITITTNRLPVAANIYRSCAPATDTTFAVEFYDPDAQSWNSSNPCAQVWSAVVVTPPQFGTISASNGLYLTYTPTYGSTSKWDHFTYKVNDTVDDSGIATATLQIRNPAERASNLVILVVNDTLLQPSSLSNEVYRLRDDLVREGYTSKLKSWHNTGTVPSNLWSYLVSEYTNTTQYLAGAILIGELPRAYVTNSSGSSFYTDFVYWNLQFFQASSSLPNGYPRNIWVSRIIAPDTTYGSEETLLRRALDANHDYRTGVSRLPYKAYLYETAMKSLGAEDTNAANRLKGIWPEADCRGGPSGTNKWFVTNRPELRHYISTDGSVYDGVGADCMVAGGEWFEEISDGLQGGLLLGDGLITTAGLYYYINQVRFHVYMSCDDGVYGGYANNTLFTRGGGCVFTMGFTHTAGVGTPQISDCSMDDTCFRGLIKAGESIGSAAVQYFAFNSPNNHIAMFYGDMSLGVMAAPSNSPPVIRSLTNAIPRGHSPVIVDFSVNAYDPDGTVSNIEWFLTGYDFGRATPTCSGLATNISYAFLTPGVYTSRVEVVDNYKARAWLENVITVMAPTACTVTAISGVGGNITPSGDVILRLGSTNSFTNIPAQWYHIGPVTVDGTNAGTIGVFTFTNILVDHTIVANFTPELAPNKTPYWWLAQYGGLTNGGISLDEAETNDADSDLLKTWQEYIVGTDPTNPASAFRLNILQNGGLQFLAWSTIPPGIQDGGMNRYYRLESTTNMVSGPWDPISGYTSLSAMNGPVFTYTNQTGYTSLFFRCKAWLAP